MRAVERTCAVLIENRECSRAPAATPCHPQSESRYRGRTPKLVVHAHERRGDECAAEGSGMVSVVEGKENMFLSTRPCTHVSVLLLHLLSPSGIRVLSVRSR
jgi:hypothetical protein